MTRQDYKHPKLSLSACSIPVMLAVAGWSATTHATDTPRSLTRNEAAFVSQAIDADNLVWQGKTAQSDASWICMSPDGQHFWVSKGIDTAVSTYRFTDSAGSYELIEEVNDIQLLFSNGWLSETDAAASGWVDLELSDDSQFLYQIFGESGSMAVYEIEGGSLSLIELLNA